MDEIEKADLCSFTMDYEKSKILLSVIFNNRMVEVELQESDVLSMKQWFDLAKLRNVNPELFNQ
ncbi:MULTISPECIES: hypothetical protein [unclassified Exiguobacterium]|uniref:hypothetical protein n=1 Tax=unclassified Exiguobacterium TaxID=2644629 RepID=UPI001BEA6D21|nr:MULTISPECIES: hypothetical protein [unclassified Exiguobacterium]